MMKRFAWLAGAAVLAAAVPASAGDAMMTLGPPAPEMVQIASYYAPAGTFFLADGQTQVIRFAGSAQHTLCLEAAAPSLPVAVGQTRTVGLRAAWGASTRVIYPGECARIDAKVITVQPDGKLRSDEALRAHIKSTQVADAAGS